MKLVWGERAGAVEGEYPAAIIARVGNEGDLLVDAIEYEGFKSALWDLMANNTVVAGKSGRWIPVQLKGLHDLLAEGRPTSSRVLKVEQSNSSIIFGEQIYLKLFRKLDEGLNPDLEVTKKLSERCGFPCVPTYLGDIQYLSRGQEPAAVVMAQGFTSNEQAGWSQTLAAVDRYFDRVLSDPTFDVPPDATWWDTIPDPFLSLIEGVHLEAMRLLGERTAEMHLALASDQESPDLRPEPVILQHHRSVYQSIRTDSKHTLA